MAKMRKKVSVDKFSEELQAALKEFGDYVDSTVVREATHKTAEETAKAISEAAPKRKRNGGAYAASITSGYSQRRRRVYTETVYAEAPHYRLTHLLERPHATRNGGRTSAFPHWETGESGVRDKFIKHIKEALK